MFGILTSLSPHYCVYFLLYFYTTKLECSCFILQKNIHCIRNIGSGCPPPKSYTFGGRFLNSFGDGYLSLNKAHPIFSLSFIIVVFRMSYLCHSSLCLLNVVTSIPSILFLHALHPSFRIRVPTKILHDTRQKLERSDT